MGGTDRVDEMFQPNPEKPWLLKFEGDVEHDYSVKVAAYTVPAEDRTTVPPREGDYFDSWEKHVSEICECGHTGGDHRPRCIVEECSCVEMKGVGEWKIRRRPESW